MANVGEGSSFIIDEMSMWCELWNLFQLAYVAKFFNDVKPVLFVSFRIDYECLEHYVMCYMFLIESLIPFKVLNCHSRTNVIYGGVLLALKIE